MSTLPEFHFPAKLCQQGQKKVRIFLDYGTTENVAIRPSSSNPQGYDVIAQRDHWKNSWPMTPLFPAIPFTTPNTVPSSVDEPVMHPVVEFRKMLRKMITFLRQSRTRCQTKPVRDALSSRLQSIRLSASSSHSEQTDEERKSKYKHIYLNALNMHIPQLVQMSHNILGRNINTEDINSQYCGGCVSYESWPLSREHSSVGFTAFPSGPSLNQLSICAVGVSTDHSLQVKERLDFLLSDEEQTERTQLTDCIYEITTVRVKERCFCACRMERNCFVYEVAPTENGLNATRISSHSFSDDEKPLSIALSPYIPCECVIATDQGNIHLLKPSSIRLISRGLKSRFESWVIWFRCFFGSNPRLLIVADRSGISQIDFKGVAQAKDLFALPSKHLNKSERIMMMSAVEGRPHYYLISTSLNIILLDDRCPNRPILHWSHALPSSPVYFSFTSLDDDHTLFAACDQESSTSLFYSVRFSREGLPPISAGTPFKAAKTCDFTYALSTPQASFNHITLNERIDVPLAGVCLVPLMKNSFIFLQITGFGDVFQQAFTQSSGASTTVSPEMSTWCMKWYHDLEKSLLRSRQVQSKLCDFDIDNIISMPRIPLPHVLCPFCMAKNWAMRRPFIGNMREYFAGMSCYACGHALIESAIVTSSSKEDCIAENLSRVNFSMSKLKEVKPEEATDPLSRLLVKLWKGETDISEEVEARDVLIKERYSQLIKAVEGSNREADASEGNLSLDFDEQSSDSDAVEDPVEDPVEVPVEDPVEDDIPGCSFLQNITSPVEPEGADVEAGEEIPSDSRKRKRNHSGSSVRSDRSAITAFPGFLAGPKPLPSKRLSSPIVFSPVKPPAKKKQKYTIGF